MKLTKEDLLIINNYEYSYNNKLVIRECNKLIILLNKSNYTKRYIVDFKYIEKYIELKYSENLECEETISLIITIYSTLRMAGVL